MAILLSFEKIKKEVPIMKFAMYMRVGNAEEFKTQQKTTIEENCKLENITVDLYSTDELIENVLYGEIRKILYSHTKKGENKSWQR